MALVPCKYCGKEVSDKAGTCPHCGKSLLSEKTIICAECGSEVPISATACPACGFPVNNDSLERNNSNETNWPKTKTKNKKRVVVSVVVFAFILVGCIAGVLLIHRAKVEAEAKEAERIEAEYYLSISETVDKMLQGAIATEDAGELLYNVWYNSIFEIDDVTTNKYTRRKSGGFYEDFNDALKKLYDDYSFSSQVTKIMSNQKTVDSYMKALANPPDNCTEAYSVIEDLYSAYLDLTNCVTDPIGYNITSYLTAFKDADTAFLKYYKKMSPYLVDNTD